MELTTVKTDKAKEYVRSTFNYNYSDIETITIDQVKDYVQKSKTTPWDIVRIEPTWDREALLKSALNEMTKVPMKVKDPEIYAESYSGISIQKVGVEKTEEEENYNSISRNSVPGEPIFTRIGTLYFTRSGFSSTPYPFTMMKDLPEDIIEIWKGIASKPGVTAPHYLNKWATTWPKFLLRLAEHNVIAARGRYLRAIPDQYAKKHYDGEARLHIPLTTNDKCFFRFHHGSEDNKRINAYHLPVTGDAYLFNAYVPHDFGNFGDTERTHVVFGLPDHFHPGWPYYFPHFKTWEDVFEDYHSHLKSFPNPVEL